LRLAKSRGLENVVNGFARTLNSDAFFFALLLTPALQAETEAEA
jgi:hypothetical protein